MQILRRSTVIEHTVNVPQSIYNAIEKLEYKRKEQLYIIVNTIYSRNWMFKNDAQKKYGFIEISKNYFHRAVGGQMTELTKDINFLIDNGFIIRNNFYDKDEGKCKGYKIASEHLTKVITYTLTNPKLIRLREKDILEEQNTPAYKLEPHKHHYFKTLKIKYEEAMAAIREKITLEIETLLGNNSINYGVNEISDLIDNTGNYEALYQIIMASPAKKEFLSIMHRMIQYQISVEKINDGYLYFKRNRTNGRLDHNITSLPGFLRKYIDYDKNLFQIDLKSSQPFFLYTTMKDEPSIDKKELEHYASLVLSGGTSIGLYEYMVEEYYEVKWEDLSEAEQETKRKAMKNILFKIYYSKNPSFPPAKIFFGSLFPTINRFIKKKKEVDHKIFSNELQRLESRTMIDEVLGRLKALGIIPLTIHDSIICDGDERHVVINTINSVMIDTFGCNPNLHMYYLESSTNTSDNDEYEEIDYEN